MPVAWSSSEIIRIRIQIWTQKFKYKDSSPLEIGKIHRHTGQHPFGGGGQTEFCPNGEDKLFVTREKKIIMNYCSAYFLWS